MRPTYSYDGQGVIMIQWPGPKGRRLIAGYFDDVNPKLRREMHLPKRCSGTERQLIACIKRLNKLAKRASGYGPCVGCCSGIVRWDQGSDFCSACLRRDRPW